MNKLYFVLPVLAWIGCYFVWTYSGPIVEGQGAATFWWLLTDVFCMFLTIGLGIFAVYKNQDL